MWLRTAATSGDIAKSDLHCENKLEINQCDSKLQSPHFLTSLYTSPSPPPSDSSIRLQGSRGSPCHTWVGLNGDLLHLLPWEASLAQTVNLIAEIPGTWFLGVQNCLLSHYRVESCCHVYGSWIHCFQKPCLYLARCGGLSCLSAFRLQSSMHSFHQALCSLGIPVLWMHRPDHDILLPGCPSEEEEHHVCGSNWIC